MPPDLCAFAQHSIRSLGEAVSCSREPQRFRRLCGDSKEFPRPPQGVGECRSADVVAASRCDTWGHVVPSALLLKRRAHFEADLCGQKAFAVEQGLLRAHRSYSGTAAAAPDVC